MSTIVEPTQFETVVTPQIKQNRNRLQYDFDALLARQQETTFVFVDYLFDSQEKNLHGAVATFMRAVSTKEGKQREKMYKNPQKSPYYWQYKIEDPAVSWITWIKSKLRDDGYSSLYDTSFNGLYGKEVEERVVEERLLDTDEVHIVECVGGRRLSEYRASDFEAVYDSELMRLVREAEEHGLESIYDH